MNAYAPASPNSYVEMINAHVIVLRGRALEEVTRSRVKPSKRMG